MEEKSWGGKSMEKIMGKHNGRTIMEKIMEKKKIT